MNLEERAKRYLLITEKSVRGLVDYFKSHPYNFFSESDVKCVLFELLFQHKEMNTLEETFDGKLTWPPHSEVSYFDENGKLFFHVDLSVIDPSWAKVYSKPQTRKIKLAKGYEAPVCYSAIELKLNKMNRKAKMFEKWEKDIRKLADIKTRNKFLTCFSIFLDKKNNKLTDHEFRGLCINHPDVRIVYANAEGQEFFGNFP